MKTLQERAEIAHGHLEMKLRGEGDNAVYFQCIKENAPDWMTDLCREAHEDMLPNDWSYSFIEDALEKLMTYEEADEIQLEANIYNHELLEWVGSNLNRSSYVDDAMSDGYNEFFALLTAGQMYERDAVLSCVRNWLETHDEAFEETEKEMEAVEA